MNNKSYITTTADRTKSSAIAEGPWDARQ